MFCVTRKGDRHSGRLLSQCGHQGGFRCAVMFVCLSVSRRPGGRGTGVAVWSAESGEGRSPLSREAAPGWEERASPATQERRWCSAGACRRECRLIAGSAGQRQPDERVGLRRPIFCEGKRLWENKCAPNAAHVHVSPCLARLQPPTFSVHGFNNDVSSWKAFGIVL
ncbi:hypothetical protein CC80DRAFT_171219 [Byssothecium circinans]|uniref:Uncharacterized protein n=1 Tax=Byssothecium circinans TaxID=147558 RepID=A0A6A5TL19_9PLEO|nr:hypothetical protein CC80DRAFT_171219 [Byssothecium circinans]